jgi:hypothetical protein
MSQNVFAATRFAASEWGAGGFDGVGFYTGGHQGNVPAGLDGTATAFGDPIQVRIGAQTLTLSAYADVPGGIVLTTADFTTFYVFIAGGFDPSHAYPLTYSFDSATACFAAGTGIATHQGEVSVEALRVGDLVATPRSGGLAGIRWIGQRRVSCRGPNDWPVRVAVDAFAPGQPNRTLLLSPDHAVFVDGGLIPVRHLLNGATVAQTPVADMEYWHVELPRHDVLLAQGLPVESFLDTGNRASFDTALPRRPAAQGQAQRIWQEHACAPLRLDAEAHVPVRRHLLARAASLGHATTDDPALRLLVDGAPLPAQRDGWHWRVELPPGARRLELQSRSAVPAQLLLDSADHRRTDHRCTDHRCLGVAVVALTLDGAVVPQAMRGRGWHRAEAGLQWTAGHAEVAIDSAPHIVEIALAPLLRYWLPQP